MTTGNNSHDHLAKLMGGMVAGIFGIAAILALGLLFFRRRAQRLSESQANVVKKQEQPLMKPPIVPYSNTYGSEL